jgi:hypothetical protein
LRVLSAGRGHFSPERSNLVTIMTRHVRQLGERMQADRRPIAARVNLARAARPRPKRLR